MDDSEHFYIVRIIIHSNSDILHVIEHEKNRKPHKTNKRKKRIKSKKKEHKQ